MLCKEFILQIQYSSLLLLSKNKIFFIQYIFSDEDKEKMINLMKTEYAALSVKGQPALVVCNGPCLMYNCNVKESFGTGILSALDRLPKAGEALPVVYLNNSVISNCGNFPGVEVRAFGSAILENCEIKNNSQGISSSVFPRNLILRNCNIFNNKLEGVIAQEKYTYDNENNVLVENCNIHHNQIGISICFPKYVSIKNNSIHSNRSWGIALRNATTAFLSKNDVFRNECGGIRIMFNRFHQTLMVRNEVHDHTGPDVMQTRYYHEGQEEDLRKVIGKYTLTSSSNKVPVLLLDNIFYNNNIRYSGISQWKIFSSGRCDMCQRSRARLKCQICLYVSYCSTKCQELHRDAHEEFCRYSKEKVIRLELEKMFFSPRNKTIEDWTRNIPLSSKIYKNRFFLIKITHGDNHYGLSSDVSRTLALQDSGSVKVKL